MIPEIPSLSPLTPANGNAVKTDHLDKEALRQAAQDFEATYIAQMLTFSGLDKALTAGGGDDMSAFTSFYIQSFADNIAENGGFGLAETFYNQMLEMSGVSLNTLEGDDNVELGRL